MAESKKKAAAKRTGTQSPKVNKPGKKAFIVVGLGASAGGVKALQEFFATMPPNSGMAFAVVLHLDPHHESNLTEILQAQTTMPVVRVDEVLKVEPNTVYVIPPNHQLELIDGVIRSVRLKTETGGERAAIDVFFRTLADAYESNSVGVVLSGAGADGTQGLKRIKEANGFAIVQDPEEAEYDSMPRTAIESGLIDWVLPVKQMPEKLINFKASSDRLHLTEDDGSGNAQKIAAEIQAEESLREILALLRVRTGHDFSNYKTPTLVRRIARHLQIHEIEDIPSYLAFLRENPDEIISLQKNLLINVTNFFRDRAAFEALEKEVIPKLFIGKTMRDTVRVWCAAYASGEEAYSLAMLLHEHAETLREPPKIQIFATDVDDDAIAEGREHSYPNTISADVSEDRLRKFFVKEGARYRVKKELREMVLFAPHNILRDPPFSKLDLVTCRNLLIYLDCETQERVMEIFHFSLRHGGYLFLGNSETAEGVPELFSTIDKKHRIYHRRASHLGMTLTPQMPLVGRWEINLPNAVDRSVTARRVDRDRAYSLGEVHYKLLEKFAPPSVLVNEEFDVIYMSESVGRYLRFAGGEPSRNILKLVNTELLPDLRAALFTAQREKKSSETPNVRVMIDGEQATVNLIVRAVEVQDEGANFLLIIFDETGRAAREADREIAHAKQQKLHSVITTNKDDAMETVVRRLEEDLQRTRFQLRTTIEQHEVSVEELKASNEELQAINEELRSAGEELETSKEELQSVNEELITVNHELKEKIDETTRTNSDLQNLMSATDIATIFLDKHLRIKRYTPSVEEFFNITRVDVGRPLEHFTHKLNYDDLRADADRVLRKLAPIEREITDKNNHYFLARFVPYRTLDDRIDGVVLNFIDITERKKTEEALRRSEEKYRTQLELEVRDRTAELNASRNLLQATMDATLNMIQVFEAVRDEAGEIVDFKYILLNHDAERWMPDSLGKNLLELQPGVVREGIFDAFKQVVETGVPQQYEKHYAHEQFDGWFHQSVVKLNDGVVTTTATITDRKKAEQELQHSKALLQDIIDAPDIGIAVYKAVRNKKGEIIDFVHEYINRASVAMLGEDYTGRLFTDHGENAVVQMPQFIEAIETGRSNGYLREADFRGNQAWFSITNTPLDDERLVHTWEDVTERQNTEAEILRLKDEIAQKATDKYRTLFESIDEGFTVFELKRDKNGKVVDMLHHEANAAYERYTGLKNVVGKWATELLPNLESSWFEKNQRVADTGIAIREEDYLAALDRWISSHHSRIGGEGSNLIAVVFSDITERKRREEQQAFLLKLSDALRPLADAEEIRLASATVLGRHLKANRVAYSENISGEECFEVTRNYVDGVPEATGRYRYADYGLDILEQLESGQICVQPDIRNDSRLSDAEKQALAEAKVGASLNVPLVKNGRLVAFLGVNYSAAHDFKPDEIELVRETAERTWAAVERARVEEELRESEDQFRRSIEDAPIPVIMHAEDGEVLQISRSWTELTGYTLEDKDVIQTWLTRAYGFGGEEVRDSMENAFAPKMGKPLRAVVFNIITKQGEHRTWSFSASTPGTLRDGRRFVVGMAEDITERREASELLRKSEEQLNLILESAKDYAIITYDLKGRITRWNAGAEKIFGWTEAEAAGKTSHLIFTPEDIKKNEPEKEMREALEKGRAEDERWHLRKDGSRFFASGVMQILRDGKKEGFVKICRDQTERIAAETALREKETLEKLVTAQEDERKRIARDLHDELGQQLTALRIKLDAVIKNQKDPVLRNQLYEIQNIARTLDDGVDFLAWELRPTSLDDLGLAPALDNYIKQWSRYSGVKAELTTSNLKRARFAPEIETCLYRIVQEALNNTHKHAQATTADIILEKRGDLLILIVEDNGKGFNPKSKKIRSKGIGLIGMRERAALVGGTLEIETAPKQGTTIYVRIPFSAAKEK